MAIVKVKRWLTNHWFTDWQSDIKWRFKNKMFYTQMDKFPRTLGEKFRFSVLYIISQILHWKSLYPHQFHVWYGVCTNWHTWNTTTSRALDFAFNTQKTRLIDWNAVIQLELSQSTKSTNDNCSLSALRFPVRAIQHTDYFDITIQLDVVWHWFNCLYMLDIC